MRDFDNFDRDFNRQFEATSKSITRGTSIMLAFGIMWVVFLMGCLGTALFLLGRWTGVW